MENYLNAGETRDPIYECLNCGALVFSKATHNSWHADQDATIKILGEAANRYKPPPVYGG